MKFYFNSALSMQKKILTLANVAGKYNLNN